MFSQKLELIEKLKKEKRYDDAWKEANSALIKLAKSKDEMWFMIYYQMADILAREKKWFQALKEMGFVIHYLEGLGGASHEKFVKRLLKKFDAEDKLDAYVELCINNDPRQIESRLETLVR